MVKRYEAETWYKFDVLLDWESRKVALFIDGMYMEQLPFYSQERDDQMKCKESFVNMI